MRKSVITKACLAAAIVMFIIGTVFIILGFNKKDVYNNWNSYGLEDDNAYVGGDAYNYIINANYFTGYVVLGSAFYICTAMLACTALYLVPKREEQVMIASNINTATQTDDTPH